MRWRTEVETKKRLTRRFSLKRRDVTLLLWMSFQTFLLAADVLQHLLSNR